MAITAVQLLLHDPDFPSLLSELNQAWEAEKNRRQRFRAELTPEMKAEFIDGEVLFHSPAMARHIEATLNLASLLRAWVVEKDLGLLTVEKALVCLTRNDYEPDIAFFGTEKAAAILPTDMTFPAPDFVVEVLSPSTERVDRGVKMTDYARHGVHEYWLVDAGKQSIECYCLDPASSLFVLRETVWAEQNEPLRSSVISGFEISSTAVFDAALQHQEIKRLLMA